MFTEVRDYILEQVQNGTVFSDMLIQQRVDGMSGIRLKTPAGWVTDELAEFDSEQIERFLATVDTNWEDRFSKMEHVSRAIDLQTNARLRIMAYLTSCGESKTISVRFQPRVPLSLDKIGMPPNVKAHMLGVTRGLILVSGPTSTGKSTSVAAIVDHINNNRAAHIVSIEDPIEYSHVPVESIFSPRQVGADVASFADGVKWAMRQVPDVIVIGEIIDAATAEAAMRAGESGHLVIATLHANSAVGSLTKLASFFPPDQEKNRLAAIGNMLVGVISQALLPNVEQTEWVLAAELLFNHKRQVADKLQSQSVGSIQELLQNNASEKRLDEISISMADSVRELVQRKQVSLQDALSTINLGADFATQIANGQKR